MMNRRDVLALAVSTGVASALLPTASRSAHEDSQRIRIIDTNISLFRWPFRRLPLDNLDEFVTKLYSLGIAQAWAGSFEGILHRDITDVNQRLADACLSHLELIPIGSINPELPDWQYDLRRCVEVHDMPGIRLHPNYHGYSLEASSFHQLLKLATSAGRFIQIAAAMEDTRSQHALIRVPDVDLAPLAKLMPGISGARVQILNHNLRAPLLQQLGSTPGIFFDTARVDGTDGIPALTQAIPAGRAMFGSHAPFLIPEAALIRVHESGILDELSLQAVFASNATQFLGSVHA